MYVDLLRAEWYTSVSDLLLAIEDGNAWSDLKLPGRLKLEIKSELLALQSAEKTGIENQPFSSVTTTLGEIEASSKAAGAPIERQQWMKYFCAEHQTYFYSNLATHESQWEEPKGENHDIYDDCTSSAEVSPQRGQESSTKSGGLGANDDNEGEDNDDDDGDAAEEEIWRALLRSVGSTNPTAAELVVDGSSNRNRESPSSSAHKKSDIIVVSDAYVIPDEISLGVVESSMPRTSLRSDFGRSSSDRSISTTDDDLRPPSYTASVAGRTSSASRRGDRESGSSSPDPLMAQRLIDMGFSPAAVSSSLRRSDNNLSAAASILLAGRRASITAWDATGDTSRTTVTDLPSAASAARRVAARLGLPRMFPPPSAPPPPSYPGLR
jgi:hypothetical protein